MSKGENTYFPEGVFQVNQARTKCINKVAIIPYGYPKNFRISDEAKPGDTIVFNDNKPHIIKAKCIVNVASPVAEAFSQLVFDDSMRNTFNSMLKKYERDIQNETVTIIIYE